MLLGALRVAKRTEARWYWVAKPFGRVFGDDRAPQRKSELPQQPAGQVELARLVLHLGDRRNPFFVCGGWCSRSRREAPSARKIIYFEPHREQIGYRDERVRFLDVGCGDHLFWATARRLCRSALGEEQVPLRVCQAEHHQVLQRARRLLSLRMDAQGHERPNAELSALSSRSLRRRLLPSYPRRSIAKRQRNRSLNHYLSTINSSEPARTPGSIGMQRDAH
jgi:hypothetical protein